MTYYVFTLDAATEKVTAALSFPDKKSAARAYETAYVEMGKDYGSVDLYSDCIEVIPGKRIEYQLPSRDVICFEADDFEIAEQLTEKFLAEEHDYHLGIRYMRYVKLIADGVIDFGRDKSVVTPPRQTRESTAPLVELDIADYRPMAQAANGKGVPKSAVEAVSDESIEWADEPAEVVVTNKEPIATSESPDSPVIQAIERQTATIQEIFRQPIGAYLTDRQKPFAPEDIPDESKGFFLSQNDYAKKQKCRVSTLRKYREISSGATTISKDGVEWIRDKVGNLLRRVGNNRNSSYEYYVKNE